MDEARLREVYAASYPRLVGQLVGVTGDPAEAEDVVMEAFARAAPRRSSFHEADNPEAWLRTVAVNVARSRWRGCCAGPTCCPSWSRPRSYADLPEDRLALLAALRQLPAAQREAIALHHLADLPVAEVAAHPRRPRGHRQGPPGPRPGRPRRAARPSPTEPRRTTMSDLRDLPDLAARRPRPRRRPAVRRGVAARSRARRLRGAAARVAAAVLVVGGVAVWQNVATTAGPGPDPAEPRRRRSPPTDESLWRAVVDGD